MLSKSSGTDVILAQSLDNGMRWQWQQLTPFPMVTSSSSLRCSRSNSKPYLTVPPIRSRQRLTDRASRKNVKINVNVNVKENINIMTLNDDYEVSCWFLLAERIFLHSVDHLVDYMSSVKDYIISTQTRCNGMTLYKCMHCYDRLHVCLRSAQIK